METKPEQLEIGQRVTFPVWEMATDWRSRLRWFILRRVNPFWLRYKVAKVIGWPRTERYAPLASTVTEVNHETGTVTFDYIPSDLNSFRVATHD